MWGCGLTPPSLTVLGTEPRALYMLSNQFILVSEVLQEGSGPEIPGWAWVVSACKHSTLEPEARGSVQV